MFHLAALLSIQLFALPHVFAGGIPVHYINMSASRGEDVEFYCNKSMGNITQIQWTKGNLSFAHLISGNKSLNVLPDRLIVEINLHSTYLRVPNVQCGDAGIYKCDITSSRGLTTTVWNLTVSAGPEEVRSSWSDTVIYTSVMGLLLCGLTTAVCLYRKRRATTSNQNPVYEEINLETGNEVVLAEPQAHTERRTNNKQRSQYMERLNSIYDAS